MGQSFVHHERFSLQVAQEGFEASVVTFLGCCLKFDYGHTLDLHRLHLLTCCVLLHIFKSCAIVVLSENVQQGGSNKQVWLPGSSRGQWEAEGVAWDHHQQRPQREGCTAPSQAPVWI